MLASRGSGWCVILLATSGGGLVVAVVTTFPRTGNPYWAFFARLTPLLSSARGSSSRELGVGWVVEAAVAPCVVDSSESECCELLYLSELRVVLCKFSGFMCMLQEGCSCCYAACVASVVAQCVRAVVSGLAVDLLAMVLPCGGRLQESPGAVLFVIFGAFGCVEVHRLVSLSSGEFWLVRSGGFSQIYALVVLVEVLPGPACVASVVLLDTVFSLKCAVWLGCILVRSSQDISWHFWWRCGALGYASGCCVHQLVSLFVSKFLNCVDGTLCVPIVRVVCVVSHSRCALADGDLVSCVESFPLASVVSAAGWFWRYLAPMGLSFHFDAPHVAGWCGCCHEEVMVFDATVILVATSLCVAFLSCLASPSRLHVAPGQRVTTMFHRFGRLAAVRVAVSLDSFSILPSPVWYVCGLWAAPRWSIPWVYLSNSVASTVHVTTPKELAVAVPFPFVMVS
ncbi:hypothetical protein Taro_050098 [Colocasia esculenta]|uniref:Uncharacterized protein n=1 Tax=Colocasia esculenta TaxID=4460 RepID=A0A843XCZ6_COLES|nr:hypothetical protein [Colocasia esculenta]